MVLIIRRMRCELCKKIHHELPDLLVPYKRYGSESIEQVISTSSPTHVAADESTLYRWRNWFNAWTPYAIGCLTSISIRLQLDYPVENSSEPAQTVLVLDEWRCSIEEPLDEETLQDLKNLRSWLGNLVVKVVKDDGLQKDDLDKMNHVLKDIPVYREIEPLDKSFHLSFVPLKHNWDWFKSEVVFSFAGFLCKHDANRLRICVYDACRWVFFDESRNRSRRWCNHKTCGNRINVRHFRKRNRTHS
jgi:predicted RNA-binding Zn ribbon-like protein